ncbi:MAG: hypothetical protein R3331_03405 [Sulfurospirillaceae bacterium]|nr:hypothetical protein [Sulfurospirillaceae bacterium]
MNENNIHNAADTKVSVSLLTKERTAWMSQAQIVDLFTKTK